MIAAFSAIIAYVNIMNTQKGDFYIYFINESNDKMYKLHYNFNIIITEVS